MSSLTQFEGRVTKRGVGLIAYKVVKQSESDYGKDCELIEGTSLPVLYEFFRKPAGMFGQFVVFRINGREEVPDLSIPIRLEKMPGDAVRVPDQAALRYWLDNGTGKPNVGVCFHRRSPDDDMLDTLLKRAPVRDVIEGTEFPRLYVYEKNGARGWHQPMKHEGTDILSFEILPPGAIRIGDQAALRCWLDDGD